MGTGEAERGGKGQLGSELTNLCPNSQMSPTISGDEEGPHQA